MFRPENVEKKENKTVILIIPPVGFDEISIQTFYQKSWERKKMAKRPKKAQKTQVGPEGYVIVAFSDNSEQAKEYEILLKSENIPVVIKQNDEKENESGSIVIMVPEDYLDEANVVIESQDAYDDFYDFVLENEDETNLEEDIFEQEF
jgi:transposase